MVLLDTNVLSELARPKPDESVVRFCGSLVNAKVSVVTLHELYFGAELVKAKVKRRRILDWIEAIELQFSEPIVPVSKSIAVKAGELRAQASKKGRVLHVEDALIAATAFDQSMSLATRNTKDFHGIVAGVGLINPWE